jgi:hypothetical protein
VRRSIRHAPQIVPVRLDDEKIESAGTADECDPPAVIRPQRVVFVLGDPRDPRDLKRLEIDDVQTILSGERR